MIKNPPAHAGDRGLIPGGEDTLEKGMATHSSFLAWRILWTEEPGGYSPWGRRVGYNGATYTYTHLISDSLPSNLVFKSLNGFLILYGIMNMLYYIKYISIVYNIL